MNDIGKLDRSVAKCFRCPPMRAVALFFVLSIGLICSSPVAAWQQTPTSDAEKAKTEKPAAEEKKAESDKDAAKPQPIKAERVQPLKRTSGPSMATSKEEEDAKNNTGKVIKAPESKKIRIGDVPPSPAPVDPANLPADRPIIKVDKVDKDFGEVWVGPTLTHEFTITNDGKTPLEITNVRPACGCTIAGTYPKSLAPGESGKFPFSIATTKLRDKFEKQITVTSNDPATPDLKLKLMGNCKRYVDISPPNAVFGKIVEDEQQERVLSIVNNSEGPLTITLSEQPADSKFKFELAEKTPGKTFELRVTAIPPFQAGALKGTAVLTTNIENQKTIEVMANAMVPERLDVQPPSIVINAGVPSAGNARPLQFTNFGKTPVKVLEAKSDDPEKIKTTVHEQVAGKSYQIQVEWPADYVPPDTGKKITLVTDDPNKPTIDIPVNAARKPPVQQQAAGPKGAELLIGKPAPNFSLTTMDGKTVSNAELNGKVTVLDFWAPNCGFCKKQMPRVEPLRADYEPKGVQFLYVSETMRKEFTEPEIQEILKTINVNGPVAIDKGNTVGMAFSAQSYPTMVVLGKDGKVEAVNSGNLGDLETRMKAQMDALLEGKPIPQFAAAPPAAPPAQPQKRPAELMVGKTAPNFTIETMEGKKLADSDFANHPATILNFVAPNCGFCKKQLPTVEAIRTNYEAKGVRFVNMSQTMRKVFPPEEAADVFKGAGSRLELAIDADNKVGQMFQATSYPTMVVVGKDGKIAHVNVGAAPNLDAKLKAQLDSLIEGKPYVEPAAPAPVAVAPAPGNAQRITINPGQDAPTPAPTKPSEVPVDPKAP